MDVTVMGLGMMGSTLAQLLLRAGHRVHVWNRSAAKVDALVREGALRAPSAAEAVRAAEIVVICVHDYAAADSFLRDDSVASGLAGRVVVQLTTGSPQEARDGEGWVQRHGGAYVDGAIQAAPGQMGTADTPILVSGANDAYRRAEPVLRLFGGGLVYLGESAGAAATMDLATLSYVYGAVIGFLHGARVSEVEGIGVDAYGEVVARIAPGFGDFLKHEGKMIHEGRFEVTQSPMTISIEAVERMLRAATDAGINDEFPAFAAQLLRRAAAAGLETEELAALIKVLRVAS